MADESSFTDTTRRTEGRTDSPGLVIVDSFDSYSAAQAAVDALADQEFPVERLSVVGRDLVMVERVTGRRNIWRAAADGAWAGAFVGAVIGFFFGLFDWVEPLVSAVVLAFWGVVLGAVIGAAVSAAGHWALGGRRDFSSVTSMEAGGYDLMADPETAAEVRAILRGDRSTPPPPG